jgi:predicted transcriptional regulator
MELNFEKALMIAVCNVEEGKTVEEIANRLNKSTESVQSTLGKMRKHGYVIANQEKAEKGHSVMRYRIKPKAFNESREVLMKYLKLTRLGVMMLEDGFNGHSIGS